MASESGWATVGGVRLRYARSGGGWSRVARALAPEFDVVTYDMRGHGESDAPAAGYAPADYAGDLLGLVAELDLGRPLVLGHSLGAVTASQAAATAPAAFRAVALEDPPWVAQAGGPGAAEQGLAYAAQWRDGTLALQRLDHAGRVAACRAEHPGWVDEDCDAWARSKELVRPQIFDGFLPMMAQPWREVVAKIQAPLLLVASDPALGGLVTPEVADEVVRLAPRARAVRIDGAGHAIHREQLDTFVTAVRGFFTESL
jgi:pimeloyl-ACP methyl ester carboxylesterase